MKILLLKSSSNHVLRAFVVADDFQSTDVICREAREHGQTIEEVNPSQISIGTQLPWCADDLEKILAKSICDLNADSERLKDLLVKNFGEVVGPPSVSVVVGPKRLKRKRPKTHR